MDELVTFRISLQAAGADETELNEITRQLRAEVRDTTDVAEIDLVPADVPPGAKAGEAIQLGTLAVQMLPGAIPGLITVLRSWTARQRRLPVKVAIKVADRSIELEYPIGTMSQADLMRLITTVTSKSPKNRGEPPNR